MKFNFNNPPISKRVKDAVVGIVALGAGLSAGAQKTESKQDNPIKPTNEAVAKAFASAEKVTKDPTKEGYTQAAVKDGKTFFIKTMAGAEISITKATPGGPKDDKANEDYLISQLKKGVSPEELVKAGHAGTEGIQKLAHFYTPSAVKVVFTENTPAPKVESDPFAGFSKDEERKFGPNNKPVFDVFYAVKSTQDVKDAGMLNTSEQDVLMRMLDQRYGHDGERTGDYIILSSEESRKILGLHDGSKYVGQEALDEITKRAKEFTASQKNKVREIGPDFTKKSNTVGLPGTDIAKGNK